MATKSQKKINIADIKMGTFSIPNFDFEQSMRWLHEARYERIDAWMKKYPLIHKPATLMNGLSTIKKPKSKAVK